MNSLPDYPQALQQALAGVTALGRVDSVELSQAGGQVLARPIVADRDLPPFDRAQMDGYALRAAEFGTVKHWPVAHSVSAGSAPPAVVPPGHCVAIATGAALPNGLDAVVQHELSDRGDRAGKLVTFSIDTVQGGHAVHHRGADAKAGEVLVDCGTILNAQHLGIAAAVGAVILKVNARPRCVLLTSGNEVTPPDVPLQKLQQHEIRNSNGPMIIELLRRFGADPIRFMHLRDKKDQTIETVREAIAIADLVITVGGVSAGDRDFFPAAFLACGVNLRVSGANIQPGKPVCVGAAPNGSVVVALPGNPVSSLACACLFVWPIVRAMLGIREELPWRTMALAEPAKPNPARRAYRPAIVVEGCKVRVPAWAGSGDLVHTSLTHGLLELPIQTSKVEAGASLRFLPWP